MTHRFVPASEPCSETIWFEIEFNAQYWDRPPYVDILIDGVSAFSDWVRDQDQVVRFQRTLAFGNHTLQLIRSGKTDDQTRMIPTGFETQTLSITRMKIDNIDVRNLIWNDSFFIPEYPEPWASQQRNLGHDLEPSVRGELHFGHNGSWHFDFSSPFYKFLVQRITK